MFLSGKIRKLLCGGLAAALLTALIPAAAVLADSSSEIKIGGNKETGSTITATVYVSGDGPYAGFGGSFSYDSKYFELQSITAGNYGSAHFSSDGANFTEYDANIGNGASIVVATFKCIAAGTGSIACNIESLGTMDGIDVSVSSPSASVTVNTPVAKSSDASLASLSISPGTLSPSFSASKTSYTATVDAAQSKITVSAKATDSKAKVSLNGVQDKLVSGENTVKITVTAENGSTNIYTIKVTRAVGPTPTPGPTPAPLPLMSYGGKEYTILTAGEGDGIPAGFSATTVKYKNVDIPALTLTYGETPDAVSVNIIYLTADNETGYFVYDLAKETCYPYVTVSPAAVSYQILGKSDSIAVPAGYEAFDYTYQEENVTAYRLISDPENPQILLYLIDGSGVSGFFYYDTLSAMILPYRGEAVVAETTQTPTSAPAVNPTLAVTVIPAVASTAGIPVPPNAISSLTDFSNPAVLLMYFFAAGFFVLAVVCIVQFIKSRRKDYEYDDEYDGASYAEEPETVSDEQPYSHFYTLNKPKGKYGRNGRSNPGDEASDYLDIPDIHPSNAKVKMNSDDPDFDPDDFVQVKAKSPSVTEKPNASASVQTSTPVIVKNQAKETTAASPAVVPAAQRPAAPAEPQRPAAPPVQTQPAPNIQQRPAAVPAPAPRPIAPVEPQRPAAPPVQSQRAPADNFYRTVPKQTGASQKGFGGIETGPKTQDTVPRTLDFPKIDSAKREEHVPVRLQRDLEMEKAKREEEALRSRNNAGGQIPPDRQGRGEKMPRGTRAPNLGFLVNDPDIDPDDM